MNIEEKSILNNSISLEICYIDNLDSVESQKGNERLITNNKNDDEGESSDSSVDLPRPLKIHKRRRYILDNGSELVYVEAIQKNEWMPKMFFDLSNTSMRNPNLLSLFIEKELIDWPVNKNEKQCAHCRQFIRKTNCLYCAHCCKNIFRNSLLPYLYKYCQSCKQFHYINYFAHGDDYIDDFCRKGTTLPCAGLHIIPAPKLPPSGAYLISRDVSYPAISIRKELCSKRIIRKSHRHMGYCIHSICDACRSGVVFHHDAYSHDYKWCARCGKFHNIEGFYSSTYGIYMDSCYVSPAPTADRSLQYSLLETFHCTYPSTRGLTRRFNDFPLSHYLKLEFRYIYMLKDFSQWPREEYRGIDNTDDLCTDCSLSFIAVSNKTDRVKYCTSCHYIHSYIYFYDIKRHFIDTTCHACDLLYMIFDTFRMIKRGVHVFEPLLHPNIHIQQAYSISFPPNIPLRTHSITMNIDHICLHCEFRYNNQENENEKRFVCSYCKSHLFDNGRQLYKYCHNCNSFHELKYFSTVEASSFSDSCFYSMNKQSFDSQQVQLLLKSRTSIVTKKKPVSRHALRTLDKMAQPSYTLHPSLVSTIQSSLGETNNTQLFTHYLSSLLQSKWQSLVDNKE
ncbi:hypothetical protein WA158_004624 [Blastocystis sp. Blastoise]